METYNIPEFRYPTLLKKIDKLNRRAEKLRSRGFKKEGEQKNHKNLF